MSIIAPSYSLPPPPLMPRMVRALAIFEHQIREQAGTLNLFLLALLGFVGVLPLVLNFYLAGVAGVGLFGSSGLATFFWPIGQQLWFFILILLVSSAGAATIARDVSTKALTMYLSRPIRPSDYLGAKAGAIAFWIFVGSVVPGWIAAIIVLALGYVSLELAVGAVAAYLLVGLFSIAAFAGLAVLFSSLTPRSTLAGAGIFGSMLGSWVVMGVLASISGRPDFYYASPVQDVVSVAAGIFGASGDPLDPRWSGAVLVAFALAAFGIAYRRLVRAQAVSE